MKDYSLIPSQDGTGLVNQTHGEFQENTRKDFGHQLRKAQAAWLEQLEDFKDEFGLVQFPLTPMLTERHLENCRLLPNRDAIIHRMRVGGIAAEVGVQTGRFSRSIIDICQPSELHLIDLDLQSFSIQEKFKEEIEAGKVFLHEGDSSSIVQDFPEEYFDFIYIDADHSYAGVKRDIQTGKTKVTERGYLIFNDYTFWSPAECITYGVIQAVNELCLEDDWELVYFALKHYMYCDVAIRRR